ncbi:hypothetical protein BU16DRAFT_175512 [Lophium mytilinum]|uniref:Uncharacterized protein n=1 Tax=Lophium mytilinum TaxID=390894 RepID=A0A6A6QA22_9PEZI|nr:hypothetical protein BU16DRAFT_175512 [Lophium mytilinum]
MFPLFVAEERWACNRWHLTQHRLCSRTYALAKYQVQTLPRRWNTAGPGPIASCGGERNAGLWRVAATCGCVSIRRPPPPAPPAPGETPVHQTAHTTIVKIGYESFLELLMIRIGTKIPEKPESRVLDCWNHGGTPHGAGIDRITVNSVTMPLYYILFRDHRDSSNSMGRPSLGRMSLKSARHTCSTNPSRSFVAHLRQSIY